MKPRDRSGFRIAALLARLAVGLLLLIASIAKGYDLVRFGRTIEEILGAMGLPESVLTHYTGHIAAGLIVLVQLGLAIRLILGVDLRLTAILTIAMFLLFTPVVLWGALSGQVSDCGCYGSLWRQPPMSAVIENIVLIGLLLIIIKYSKALTDRPGWNWLAVTGALALLLGASNLFALAPGLALRAGRPFPGIRTADAQGLRSDGLYWFFDPGCSSCIDQFERVIARIDGGIGATVKGITSASNGRIAEFVQDYEPPFPVLRINHREWDRAGLPRGSLFAVRRGRIYKVWREFDMPVDPAVITRQLD